MKKALPLLLFFGLVALSSAHQSIQSVEITDVALECQHGQCQVTAKSTGKRCKHCVSNSGDRFCYQHK
jgi:hypothetical protein